MSSLPFCDVCKKYFNSSEQRAIHEKGTSHQGKVKLLEQQSIHGEADSPLTFSIQASNEAQGTNAYPTRSVAPGSQISQDTTHAPAPSAAASLNDLCRTPLRRMSSGLGQSPLVEGNGQEYYFDKATKKGKCNICDVDLTSPQLAQQHLSGKSHEKKRKSLHTRLASPGLMSPGNAAISASGLFPHLGRNSPTLQTQSSVGEIQDFIPNVRMWKLCNAPFSSELNMKEHLVGAKHRKELQKRGLDPNLSLSQNVYANDPEQTSKKEFVQPDPGLNNLLLDEKMSSLRIQPEVESGLHNTSPNAALHLNPVRSDVSAAHAFNNGNVSHSLIQNLSEYNDKVTQLKDKQMLLPGMKADPQPPTFPTSNLSSILDNNQQPLFKSNAVSPLPIKAGLDQDLQTHHPSAQISPNHGAIQENRALPMTSTPVQSHSRTQREYEFDGIRGFCNVCSVALTSLQLAQQHLNGQPHRKKLGNWVATQLPLQEEISRPPPSSTNTSPSQQVSHSTTRSQSEDYYHFDGRQGFCRACNSALSSKQQAIQHLEGKPHKRNVLRLRTAEQGIRYPLYCEVCDKPFTGQESARQHYISDRHQLNEDLFKGDYKLLEVFEGGRKLWKNGQIWYLCDLCKKLLNTFEQFNIHRRSHDLSEFKSPRGSPMCLSPSNDMIGNSRSMGCSPGLDMSELGPSGYTSPHSRQNLIDPQGSLAQNQEFLTFGENPVVNTQFPCSKNGSSEPHHLLREMSKTEASLGPGVPANHEGSRHIKGRGDGPNCAPTNYQPEMNAQGNGSQIRGDFAHFSSTSNNISPGHNGLLRSQPISGSSSSGNVFHTSRPSASCDGSGNTSRIVREPSNTLDNCSTEDDNRGGDILSDRENNSIFGNVTIGPRPSASGSGTQDRGHKNVVSLGKAEIGDSSDDDEYNGDLSNAHMNIQGEESQPKIESSLQSAKSPTTYGVRPGVRNKYYCETCGTLMNSKKSFREHLDGKAHQWRLSASKAPCEIQGSIYKSCVMQPPDLGRAYDLTENMPRKYQISLMEKAMASDSVVYLPTGTGKTMVSVLTIGLMLEKNPRRPVIFLVDKVLLVIQQARYIKTEFEGRKFKRASLQRNPADDGNDNVEIVERELSLAFVCGGLLCVNNLPLWQHDIIVTTVDYCINLLNNESILWQDFSLAVLDEVHHCVKKHPYRRLIQDHHCAIENPRGRPKILGLTASPAGKSTVDATYMMLQNLLMELGGAKIAFVGEECQQELKSFQSNTILKCICVPLNDRERHFFEQCISYFLQCYMKLAPLSTTLKSSRDPPCSYFYEVLNHPNVETLQRVTDSLLKDAAPLSEILPFIFQAECVKTAEESEKKLYESLRSHTFQVLLLIADIPTGLDFGDLKKEFEESESNYKLNDIKALGLPYAIFYKQMLTFEQEEGYNETAMIEKLIQILKDPLYIDWNKESSKALVLVRERKQARSLARSLKYKPFFPDKALQVTHLVGHGKGNEAKGMAVKEQKKVLDNQEKYHIIVATSIAEEGVDINTVELVVSMNPPSNVTALVQMRGRARKKGSHFIILCSNQEEVDKLDELRQHEANMMEAAKRCLDDQ